MEARGEYIRPAVQEAEEHMTIHDNVAVEEMLRDAEDAIEPGDLAAGQVISRSQDMTMTALDLHSAGWVYVYDTLTADRSVVNRNMLPQQLEKRRPDGSYAFSTRRPEGVEPIRGQLKCLLHDDDPNRERYNSMGLVHCVKSNLLTELDRERHMKYRLPRAFATLEDERRREDREAERLERIALTDSIRAMADSNRGATDP